jgi:hypothetical protein
MDHYFFANLPRVDRRAPSTAPFGSYAEGPRHLHAVSAAIAHVP